MRFLLLLLAALLLFPASKSAEAQEVAATEETRPLKILSWNIYMLPRFVLITGKRKRSKRIPEQILPENYDIIVFQEAFHSRMRTILWKQLKDYYPYDYGPANNRKTPIITNSGIWILSRVPLVELGTIDFKKCHKDDCFARKGALLLGGEWQGQPFQILGTHLEAGPDHIKDVQYRELAGLLEYHWTPGVPQLLCGDFNTNSADPEQYGEMLSVLQAWNGPLLSEIQHTSSDGDEIDYILLRNADTNVVQVDRYVREFESEWKEDKAWLSDHLAVEAFVWFKKP